MANESLEVSIGEDGSGSNKLIEAINRLVTGLDKVADTSDKSAKGLKGYGDSAKTAASNSSGLAGSIDKVKGGFGALAGALSGVTALLSASKLIKYADEYTGISQKLKLVTTDQTKLNGIIEEAYGIAQRNSTGLADTAKLYGSLSTVAKALGKDQSDVAKMTETVTQAIALTGPSADEAKNGLQQFNQALASGVLRGDEFNSIMENIPGLARALAAGISSAGPITTGQLREMAEAGEITGKKIAEALDRSGAAIATLAKTNVDTVSKALVRLDNAVKKFVGQTNEAYGVTAFLAKGIDLLAKNIGPAIIALTAFTILLAAGAIASAIQSIAGLTGGFALLTRGIIASTAAMLANPLIAVGTIVAIGTVLGIMKATGVTFGDVATKIGTFAGEAGKAAIEAAKVGAAGTGAAPGVKAVADAAQGAAGAVTALSTASTAAPAAAASAAVGYGGLIGAATKVGTALKDSAASAAALPPAVAASATAATAASAGFGEVKKSLDNVGFSTLETNKGFEVIKKKLIDELPPSARVAAASISDIKLSTDALNPSLATLNPILNATGVAVTSTNSPFVTAAASAGTYKLSADALNPALVSLNTNLVAVTPLLTNSGTQAAAATASTFKLAEGTARLSATGSALGPVLEKYATGSKEAAKSTDDLAKSAEKARESLIAQNKAIEDGKKAADQFKSSLEKVTGAFNSMGEKIESASEALARFAAAKEKANQRIKDSLENLKQYYNSADTATTSTNSLGSAVTSIGGGFTDLANDTALATSQLTAFTQAANAAAVASSNASKGLSVRQQMGSDSNGTPGTSSTSGNSGTVSAGGNSFTYGIYSVGGQAVGQSNSPDLLSAAAGMSAEQQIKNLSTEAWDLFLSRNQFETSGPGFNPQGIWKAFLSARDPYAIVNPKLLTKTTTQPGFAHGGSFNVGGNGGTDSQPVSFMASPNERVTIETPAQQMQRDQADNVGNGRRREQPVTIVMNVKTDDVDSFKRSKKQIAQDMFGRLGRAM